MISIVTAVNIPMRFKAKYRIHRSGWFPPKGDLNLGLRFQLQFGVQVSRCCNALECSWTLAPPLASFRIRVQCGVVSLPNPDVSDTFHRQLKSSWHYSIRV